MSRTQPNGLAAMFTGLKSALQWRLLLWWLIALSLPTLLFSVPLWTGLNAQFAYSPQAADIAAGRDLPLWAEGMRTITGGEDMSINIGLFAAITLTVLLSPWLTGMAVAAMRANHRLTLGGLAHGGLSEYWRMVRLMLWSLIPLGIALAIASAFFAFVVDDRVSAAILESEAERFRHIGMALTAVVFVIAHATLEAARGWLGADANLRSIFRAWWRGTKLVLSRPLASLLVYVGATLVSVVLAALFALWRIHADGAGIGSFAFGLLLTQLVVASLTWGRIARLYGFAALARGRMG
jgi:hypothetical protein